jgi:hypothetical protein
MQVIINLSALSHRHGVIKGFSNIGPTSDVDGRESYEGDLKS